MASQKKQNKQDVEKLKEELTQAKELMNNISQAIEQIDHLVGMVRDISTKTDLLALNASIEAARAGQAGKGFAVVAHEVGRLSEKAQDSITQVDGACENLKGQVHALSQHFNKCLEHSQEETQEAKAATQEQENTNSTPASSKEVA